MFGIMKPVGCNSMQPDNKYIHRSHYCGTCKTMGVMYGQHTRLMLNYDAVFLAELLSGLSNEDITAWENDLRSSNCVKMPKFKGKIPASLQYAAASNIMLGSLKADDHIHDSGSWLWKTVRMGFSRSFRKAEQALRQQGVKTDALWQLAKEQRVREGEWKNQSNNADYEALMHSVAGPTAEMTGNIFRQGATAIDKPEISESFYALGYAFGKFAYIADAMEDFDKDVRNNEFNPLLVWNTDKTTAHNQAARSLMKLSGEIREMLHELPLKAGQASLFHSRLQSSMMLRIYADEKKAVSCHQPLSVRIKSRWNEAKETAGRFTGHLTMGLRQVSFACATLAVFALPQTPDYVEEPTSSKESLGILALITAFFAAIGAGLHLRKKMKPLHKKDLHKQSDCSGCDSCGDGCTGCCDNCGGDGKCCECGGACCVAGCSNSGCCDSCCQGCCDGCCENMCSGDNGLCSASEGGRTARIILLIVGIVIIGIGVGIALLFV